MAAEEEEVEFGFREVRDWWRLERRWIMAVCLRWRLGSERGVTAEGWLSSSI